MRDLEIIVQTVCMFRGITYGQIMEKTRRREILLPRQEAMALCTELTGMSSIRIGMHIGNKDHATVLHSVKAIKDLYETDKQFAHEHDILKHKTMENLKRTDNICSYDDFIRGQALRIWHETNIELNINEISKLIGKVLSDYDVYKSKFNHDKN